MKKLVVNISICVTVGIALFMSIPLFQQNHYQASVVLKVGSFVRGTPLAQMIETPTSLVYRINSNFIINETKKINAKSIRGGDSIIIQAISNECNAGLDTVRPLVKGIIAQHRELYSSLDRNGDTYAYIPTQVLYETCSLINTTATTFTASIFFALLLLFVLEYKLVCTYIKKIIAYLKR